VEHDVAVAYVEEGFGSCLTLDVIVDARTMKTEMIVCVAPSGVIMVQVV
jgi:hypothetical protein